MASIDFSKRGGRALRHKWQAGRHGLTHGPSNLPIAPGSPATHRFRLPRRVPSSCHLVSHERRPQDFLPFPYSSSRTPPLQVALSTSRVPFAPAPYRLLTACLQLQPQPQLQLAESIHPHARISETSLALRARGTQPRPLQRPAGYTATRHHPTSDCPYCIALGPDFYTCHAPRPPPYCGYTSACSPLLHSSRESICDITHNQPTSP